MAVSRVCGANSDLFGRRWFIIGGNILEFIGFITAGTAKNNTALIVGCAFIGFVGYLLSYPARLCCHGH